jgi:hypothetical protein
MSHKPPTFSNSPNPLQADDWLKSVDKVLNIAQYTDREKVLYALGHLTSPSADWWDAYCAAHATANTITWAEFSTHFRNYHIPTDLMKIKEFLTLKQGGMSISEYIDKFIQLSWYAPREVDDDEKKQELFLEGLIRPLQYQLISHTFSSFQRLLDKPIALENKRVELGKRGRLLTKDRWEVAPVPVILQPKAHQLVAVLGNKLSRPKLLLKQALQRDLLLLIHPQTCHASNVDKPVIMPTTVQIGLLILLQLRWSKVRPREARVNPYLSIGVKSTTWKQKLNLVNPKTRMRCQLRVKKSVRKAMNNKIRVYTYI